MEMNRAHEIYTMVADMAEFAVSKETIIQAIEEALLQVDQESSLCRQANQFAHGITGKFDFTENALGDHNDKMVQIFENIFTQTDDSDEPDCDTAFVYACYDKQGSDNCQIIESEIYEQYDMDLFALSIEEGLGSNLVYGIKISLEDFISKKEFPEVIEFGKKCGLNKPKHYLAITDGFDLCEHSTYNPIQLTF